MATRISLHTEHACEICCTVKGTCVVVHGDALSKCLPGTATMRYTEAMFNKMRRMGSSRKKTCGIGECKVLWLIIVVVAVVGHIQVIVRFRTFEHGIPSFITAHTDAQTIAALRHTYKSGQRV